jgi:hypothetical protein
MYCRQFQPFRLSVFEEKEKTWYTVFILVMWQPTDNGLVLRFNSANSMPAIKPNSKSVQFI